MTDDVPQESKGSESAPETKERQITPKQEAFCQAYTVHWNATKAAKDAGYSEKTAGIQGYQQLQNPLVKKRIEELAEHALKELGYTRERILQEYTRLAFYDMAEAYDEIGQLRPIKEMPEDVRRAVTKVKSFEQFSHDGGEKELVGFIKEVEFSQRKGALDSLAKCLGMAPEKLEHSGPGGGAIQHEDKTPKDDKELDARIAALMAKMNPPEKEEG